jgi:toxin ParE1/3/4
MPREFESYRLSRRAEIDLADIYAYTARNWSADQANRYIGEIASAITGLVSGSKIGRKRSDIAAGYLSYTVGSHVIFYRETEHILIARVLHGAMDLPRHLSP